MPRPAYGYGHHDRVAEPARETEPEHVAEPRRDVRVLPIPPRDEEDALYTRRFAPPTAFMSAPEADDVLYAIANEWPRVALTNGRVIEGEESWRSAVAVATSDELLALWSAIRGEA